MTTIEVTGLRKRFGPTQAGLEQAHLELTGQAVEFRAAQAAS